MDESSKVFKGAASQTIVAGILGVLGLAYFSIMSRLLTKEDFGYYAIITGITGILTEISNAGLGSAIIQKKDPGKKFIYTAFSLSFIIGFSAFVLLFTLSSALSRLLVGDLFLSVPLKIISITLLLSSLNSIGRALLMRKLKFMRYGLYEIGAFFLSSLVGIGLALMGKGVFAIIIAVVLNQFVILFVLYSTAELRPCLFLDRNYIREIISYGGWLTGCGIVRSLYNQFDKLITTRWLPVASLGAYNRPSYFVNEVGGKIFGVFDVVLFPVLSNIQDDKKKIAAAFEKSSSLLLQLSLFLASSMILASDCLIEIFFGNSWLELKPIFQILSLVLFFESFNRLTDSFFRSLGIVKKYFFVRVLVCVVSAICIILGCQFDIMGLAIGYGVSRICENIIKAVSISPYIRVDYIKMVKKFIRDNFIPLLLFAVLYFLPFQGMLYSLIVTLGYLCALAVLGFLFPHIYGELFYSQIYKRMEIGISNILGKR